jgi:hypothetical protein
MRSIYQRRPEDLKARASLYWPQELREKAVSTQVMTRLLETQETFVSILKVADASPTSWEQVLSGCSLAPNLFLKHLMILADVSGEILKRITPLKQGVMQYAWRGTRYNYEFQSISRKRISNSLLKVDTKHLLERTELQLMMKDIVMLIMHGGASLNVDLPNELQERCVLGGLLGNHEAIERFVRQRYIVVSPILRGASSNELGQEVQKYVKSYLEKRLSKSGWKFNLNGTIPGISHTEDSKETTFDIVAVSPAEKYCAIEVYFQVTTNSVIERKSGQAQSRWEKLHKAGAAIAYVIDGAGNFERESALRTLCDYSDCTIAFRDSELELLVQFLREHGGGINGTLE